MSTGLISNLGIRTRVLLLTLVPLLILSLILGHYTVLTRIHDLEDALRDRGETIARHLAVESEPALAFRDTRRLDELVSNTLRDSDVVRITIRNARNEVLSGSLGAAASTSTASVMGFNLPVLATGREPAESAAAFSATAPDSERILGWIELELSREGTLARQQSIIWSIVLLTVCAALFSVLIASWMGRGIVHPIVRLSSAVDAMRKGEFSTRVPLTTGGELGALQRGFNSMAEEIETSQTRLENRATAATGQLQQTIEILEHRNRELDAARQKALAASEEKANFLANMSHEIRTPINAVLGYASLLEKSGLTTEQHEYARTISCASTQLLRVIDDILSFSRLESGAVQLDEAEFDLRDSFEDIICMMAPEAREKRLELVLIIDSDVPVKLIGDPVRIGQIFTNLLGNAIKFTDSGGVTVQVMLGGLSGGRAEIEVRVIDTGIGIAPEALNRIFTSFHQADASITRRYGGTGLGLAIVSRLVELWGGRVGVMSEPGEGSTFWFTFSCRVQPRIEPLPVEPGLAGRKALIYDDNPAALRAVRNLLLTWSMEVFLARDQSRIDDMLAEARAAGEPYDLVILGLRLDAEDDGEYGPDRLVDLVRREHALPLLLMVNCRHTSLLSRSLSDDDIKILVKPIRRDILYRNLCALFDVHRADAAQTPSGRMIPSEFSGLRVLVAEDNEFNRTLVTKVLESAGVVVSQAMDGDAALALARDQEFDAVIMDLHLPGMDGVETARRLRGMSPGRQVPIIALTADVFASEREQGAANEMDAYLNKPLDENKLWRALRRLCLADGLAGRSPVPEPAASTEIRQRLKPRLIESILQQQQRIASAVARHDVAALAELAHELRGLTGYFGLAELCAAVAELEHVLRERQEADALIESLRGPLRGIEAQIEALTATRPDEAPVA